LNQLIIVEASVHQIDDKQDGLISLSHAKEFNQIIRKILSLRKSTVLMEYLNIVKLSFQNIL